MLTGHRHRQLTQVWRGTKCWILPKHRLWLLWWRWSAQTHPLIKCECTDWCFMKRSTVGCCIWIFWYDWCTSAIRSCCPSDLLNISNSRGAREVLEKTLDHQLIRVPFVGGRLIWIHQLITKTYLKKGKVWHYLLKPRCHYQILLLPEAYLG